MMDKRKILIIDDEQDLGEILQFNLTAAGFEAEAVCSAEEALKLVHHSPAAAHRCDLMLVDVMMPGMSGFELARRLKEDSRTATVPIIFITAKDTEDDTLRGFGLGADDYITKPFSVKEVVARVKAVLNRAHAPSVIAYEGIEIDMEQKTVRVDQRPTVFTRTEFDLLQLLLTHRGCVFSRQQLIKAVWPSDVVVTERTVDVHITRLRKKVGRYAACIVSRTGFGYCFEEGKG